MSFYDTLRYQIVPPVFLVFFTGITQVLVVLGNPKLTFEFGHILGQFFNIGTPFAWRVVLFFYAWAFLSLKVPSKTFLGPAAPHGYVPVYSANGTQYYLISLAAFLVYAGLVDNSICAAIFDAFGPIMAVLNLTSLL